MTISTRTPEGFPSRCVLCGAENRIEFSDPPGDAPCPRCGCLLWRTAEVASSVIERIAFTLGIAPEAIDLDTPLESFGFQSVDVVELVMEFEEEFDRELPHDRVPEINTLADLVRLFGER